MSDPTPTDAVNPAEPTGGDDNQEPKIPQSHVDKLVKERLQRAQTKFDRDKAAAIEEAKASAIEAWREEHGVTDDELAKVGAADKATLEMRRLKGELTKATKAAEAAAAESARRGKLLSEHATTTAVLQEARALGLSERLTLAAVQLEGRLRVDESDFSTHVIGDDGEPSGLSLRDYLTSMTENDDWRSLRLPTKRNGSGSYVAPHAAPSPAATPDTAEARQAILSKGFGE